MSGVLESEALLNFSSRATQHGLRHILSPKTPDCPIAESYSMVEAINSIKVSSLENVASGNSITISVSED